MPPFGPPRRRGTDPDCPDLTIKREAPMDILKFVGVTVTETGALVEAANPANPVKTATNCTLPIGSNPPGTETVVVPGLEPGPGTALITPMATRAPLAKNSTMPATPATDAVTLAVSVAEALELMDEGLTVRVVLVATGVEVGVAKVSVLGYA